MRIFFRDKDEEVSFNKDSIPRISIDSNIYVVSNFIFFKSNNELQVYKNNICVHHAKYNDSLSRVFYNNDLRMVAIINSKTNLELLLELDENKKSIKNIEFSKLISEHLIGPYNYYYRFKDTLEVLYQHDNNIFTPLTNNVLNRKDDEIVEIEERQKIEINNGLQFTSVTNFDYQIVCKERDNILYLIDKNEEIIGTHKNHDCVITSYTTNQENNLLATISIQNKICLWIILKERLKLWTTAKVSSTSILKDIAFSGNGKFLGVLTKQNANEELFILDIFEITKGKKAKKHKLNSISTHKTTSIKVDISNFGIEIIDNKPEFNKITNEVENKIPIINKVAKPKLEKENKKKFEEEIKQKYRVEVTQKLKEKVKQALKKDSKRETSNQIIPNSRFESFPQISLDENTVFTNQYSLPEDTGRRKIKTFIGIDIGTKFSKIMIEIESSKKRHIFPLEGKGKELFFPTEVYIADNKIYFDQKEVGTKHKTNYKTIDYLKLRFEYDQNVRMLLIVYIMNIINEAKVYAHNWRKDKTEFKFYDLEYQIAISFPETLFINGNNSNFDNFKNLVATAESLLENRLQTEYTLAEINKEFTKTKYCGKTNKITVVPESISEIFSFIEVIEKDYGQIILIDIGEGTTELSGCWVDEIENTICVWGSKILFRGVFDYFKGERKKYKQVLKEELKKLLEIKEAFYEGEGFSNPNVIHVGGGGCEIKEILSSLDHITVNSKSRSMIIESLSNSKSFKAKHSLPSNAVIYFHRFLVAIGSIEYIKNKHKYKIINHFEHEEKASSENKNIHKQKTQKELIEEIRRLYEL